MSDTLLLRLLINERLSLAATDIFGVVERKIAEYEEEVRYSKEENARLRELLNAILNPEITLQRADSRMFNRSKQEISSEQQQCGEERSPSLDQEEPEPPQIKEEDPPEQQHCEQERSSSLDQENRSLPQIKEELEDLWASQEGEQLQNLKKQETSSKDSMLTVKCVESLFNQGQTQFSQLEKFVATTSTEPDGEDCGVPEPDGSITESKDGERTLSGDKLYKCHVCSKGFSGKCSLTSHMVCHTKKFNCKICRKRFKLGSLLTTHMRNHTDEKPFKCSVCTNSFRCKSSLDFHMRYHTGKNNYLCSFCGKRYYAKYRLNAHMRNHIGEKPLKCSICSEGFCLISSLEIHMKIHTWERL